jgi:hypothetical protein
MFYQKKIKEMRTERRNPHSGADCELNEEKSVTLTFLLSVCCSVSEILRAGFLFGFELGVWTAQHFTKAAMNMTTPTSIRTHAHQ